MSAGLTSPSSDDLDVLRQQYDRLCDLMTRTAESDPAAAERVLTELQSLSDRILALEASGQGASPPVAPPPAPAPPVIADSPAVPAEIRPTAESARVVAFRVTPGTDAEGKPAAKTASWRLDSQAAALDTPSPPLAPAAAKPVAPMTTTTTAASKPAPARPAPPAPDSRARPAPATPAAPPRPAAAPLRETAKSVESDKPAADPTMFSAAIRNWLERHRDDAAAPTRPAAKPARTQTAPAKPAPSNSGLGKPERARAAASGQQPADPSLPAAGAGRQIGVTAPDAVPAGRAATKAPGGSDAPAVRPPSPELSRIAAAVEQQAAQIERILALALSQQSTLERLETEILAELRAPAPAAAPDGRIPELHAAVEEQRQRLTALAKTIHNLAQWLAAERASPRR